MLNLNDEMLLEGGKFVTDASLISSRQSLSIVNDIKSNKLSITELANIQYYSHTFIDPIQFDEVFNSKPTDTHNQVYSYID